MPSAVPIYTITLKANRPNVEGAQLQGCSCPEICCKLETTGEASSMITTKIYNDLIGQLSTIHHARWSFSQELGGSEQGTQITWCSKRSSRDSTVESIYKEYVQVMAKMRDVIRSSIEPRVTDCGGQLKVVFPSWWKYAGVGTGVEEKLSVVEGDYPDIMYKIEATGIGSKN